MLCVLNCKVESKHVQGMCGWGTMTWLTMVMLQRQIHSKSTTTFTIQSELADISTTVCSERLYRNYMWILHDFSYNERTTNNDVALLKLKNKIDFKKFSGTVTPVCLPDLPRKYYGKTVTKDSLKLIIKPVRKRLKNRGNKCNFNLRTYV